MFYELKHLAGVDYFLVIRDLDFSFQPHIHACFEVIIAREGSMQVTVDNTVYTLTPGEAVLVFPHQIHSFRTVPGSRHLLCIFSPQLVGTYTRAVADRIPQSSLFRIPGFCEEQLYALSEHDNISLVKGVLYSVCGYFDVQASYTDKEPSDNYQLLYTIFSYISKHYREDCSLEAVSHALSYHYAYISKYFKQMVGTSFGNYVNYYRINEVCARLDQTDDSILKISEECGYQSLRSMNRNFQNQTGMTPTEYRKRCRQKQTDKPISTADPAEKSGKKD